MCPEGKSEPPDGRFFYTYLVCKPKIERIHIMNPTTKLKRKGKSIVSGLHDLSDPVYNEGWMIHSGPKSIPSSKSARRKEVKS